MVLSCSTSKRSNTDLRKVKLTEYLEAQDKRKNFQPYIRFSEKELPTEIIRDYEWIKNEVHKTKIHQLVSNITSSNIFNKIENYILSNQERTYCLDLNEILQGAKDNDSLSYLKFHDTLSKSIMKNFLVPKYNLFRVILYSGINEIHLYEGYFNNSFKEKIGCTNKNIKPLRVLDDLYYTSPTIVDIVGFTSNKYQYTIIVPLIYNSRYEGDLYCSFFW